MTVTVAGNNYEQYSSCDTTGSGGTWSLGTVDSDVKMEGLASLCAIVKTAGNNDIIFTPSGSKDLSGVKHVRFWFISTHGGLLNTKALGGIQFFASDGVNTGYWYVSGKDEYPGGWYQAIIDVSKAVDAGVKPTNMNAITSMGIRVNLTVAGKNAVNFWWDNLIRCDGLIAYGDDAGGSFDFADIYSTGMTQASGVISLYNSIYYLTGNLTIGDASGAASTNFIAKNQTLVFVDKSAYISPSLYSITVVGNATGATQRFELGENSGGAGINGCTILCPNTSLAFEFTATDTDVDDFGLYGTTFNTYGDMDFQPYGVALEIIGCTFLNGQGRVMPNTMTFTDNFVVGGVHTGGSVLYESTSHNISYTNYINNSRAAEFPAAGVYTVTGDQFTGSTYDVHFSALSGDLTINAAGDPKANPSEAKVLNDSSGTVTINLSVNVTITVKNMGGTVIESARVLLLADSGGGYPYQEGVAITQIGGTATVVHAGHGLKTGEKVDVEGADQEEYNGVHTITFIDVDSYSYPVSGSPASPAMGTITSTFVILTGLTSISGLATNSIRYLSSQPFTGWARKSSGSPLYRQGIASGTIGNTDYSSTVFLALDE